ncbi:MAG: hypothetical protein WA118_07670 [Carboxydocellales bacterium]
MTKYRKLTYEIDKFIRSINLALLSKPEIKLINLIKANFDKIAETGTAGGKRAIKLNALIQTQGSTISDTLTIAEDITDSTNFPIVKLTHLEVDNFRGFSDKKIFKFEKAYTLIYGPNGTGKSSFCEALEYSMLGYIREAETKRIGITKYITNVLTGKASTPCLKGMDSQANGKEINVCVSTNDYYFCFIEKNRIDGFARITANTPSNQADLLASLFGLEDFNKFIEEFTDNFSNYIDTKGVKAQELSTKKQQLETDNKNIANFGKKLLELEQEKDNVVNLSMLYKTFDELDLFIHGKDAVPGRISELEILLHEPLPQKYDIKKIETVDNVMEIIINGIKSYKHLLHEYEKQKDKVNFRKVFQTVLELEEISKDKCPVCETPIFSDGGLNTAVHPYKNARLRLEELEEIAKLENEKEKTWGEILEQVSIMVTIVQAKNEMSKQLAFDVEVRVPPILLNKIRIETQEVILGIEDFILEIKKSRNKLIELDKKAESVNNQILERSASRTKLIEEKASLQTLSLQIKNIYSSEKIYRETIETAKFNISKFDENNKDLIKEVEMEKDKIIINCQFVEAYNLLMSKLKNYKNKLPISLLKDLNELTKEFYNTINKNDQSFELMDRIELPAVPGENIKVFFQSDPTKEIDALHVLSEGHIRCLGLAILLAKNVNDKCNIIIFDDVVNAIDDDHRNGIRELLFHTEVLKNKQIMLTSHAEEFIKDLDNQFSNKEYIELVERITFLTPENRNIRYVKTTANYLEKAKIHFGNSEKRDTLRNCRSALENLTDNLWRKLSRKYNLNVTVQIRNPGGLPDLMSKVQGLRVTLQKNIKEEKFNGIIKIFSYLAGLETTHQNVWSYLNKGTHDETDKKEFDQDIVKELLDKLLELDEEIKGIKV